MLTLTQLPDGNMHRPSASTLPRPGASITVDPLRSIGFVGGTTIPRISQHSQRGNPERGAGRLKTLIGLLVFVAVGYVAFKVVPPYVNNYQLQDAMVEEARYASAQRKDLDTVRNDVFKKMQELGIPARREDIRVETIAAGLRISLDYRVIIDLPGYQFPLQFHPTADSNSI